MAFPLKGIILVGVPGDSNQPQTASLALAEIIVISISLNNKNNNKHVVDSA